MKENGILEKVWKWYKTKVEEQSASMQSWKYTGVVRRQL